MEHTVGTKLEVREKEIVCVLEKNPALGEREFLDISTNLEFLDEGVFSHVSIRLLEKYGYLKEDKTVRLCCFVDLLLQAKAIMINTHKHGDSKNFVYVGKILLPDSGVDEIFISPNISGKMTINLPTDA